MGSPFTVAWTAGPKSSGVFSRESTASHGSEGEEVVDCGYNAKGAKAVPEMKTGLTTRVVSPYIDWSG